MKCRKIRNKLMAFHDGELTGIRFKKMEKHILSCPTCKQALKELEAVDLTITVPEPESEYWEGFTGRIMDRVKDEPVDVPLQIKVPEPKSSYKIMRLAPAFSIALVAVVAAGLLMEIRGPIAPRQSMPEVQKQVVGTDSMADRAQPEEIFKRDQIETKELMQAKRRASDYDDAQLKLAAPAGEVIMDKVDVSPPAEGSERDLSVQSAPKAEPEFAAVPAPMSEPAPGVGAVSVLEEAGRVNETAMAVESESETLSEGADEYRSYNGDFEGSVLRKKEALSDDGRHDEISLRAMMLKAEALSKEGKQEESEKVLRDLLSQSPPSPIQEDATILLVKVLQYQNRIGEARLLLTEAQAAYPENEIVQEFRLETAPADVKGGRPAGN
ncbi:hypothetical protein EP232_01795 [bacterium]|nr:MAG: hypothetical protein EP232_01795 [bacterium]